MGDLLLSLLMLGGVALAAGGVWLWTKRGERQKAMLMIAAALIMFVNVAIWLVPTESGETLRGSVEAR